VSEKILQPFTKFCQDVSGGGCPLLPGGATLERYALKQAGEMEMPLLIKQPS
jgi:hypothetical protein